MIQRPITRRQRQVLELVAEGCPNKQIAAQLHISEPGVRKHLETLFRRFGATNRTALVRAAVRSGELELPR